VTSDERRDPNMEGRTNVINDETQRALTKHVTAIYTALRGLVAAADSHDAIRPPGTGVSASSAAADARRALAEFDRYVINAAAGTLAAHLPAAPAGRPA
jgi:UDP-N-acetylmuramyl tripeptide synthase